MAGWLKLHRQIIEHELFREPRKFSKFEAWLYILLNAKYEIEVEKHYGIEIHVPIGSFATSCTQLAKAWNWDKKAVIKFLDYLTQENMITTSGTKIDPKSGTKIGTIINVENWAFYQSDGTKTRTKSGTKIDPRKREPSYIEKEEKNIKKGYAEFVFLTEEEYEKLLSDFGEKDLMWMIDYLNNYLGYNEKKRKEYASHNHVLRGWIKNKLEEEKRKNPQPKQKQETLFDPYEIKRY